MAVQQDIILNFKTNLDAAKADISQLATLYQQSLVPQGQPGAFDDSQRAQVESVVAQQAQAKGIDVEVVKKTLLDIANIQQQIEQIEEQREARQQAITELNEKAGAAAQNRMAQEQKAKEILGLTKDATRAQLEAKLAELKVGKDLNLSEAERAQKIEEVETLLRSAQAYGAASTRQSRKALDLANEQTEALEEQNQLFARIAELGDRIGLNQEEIDALEASIVRSKYEHTQAEKKNNAEKRKSLDLVEQEQRETEELNRLLQVQPDNFAKRAVSAVIYYEALNQLKRIARAAVNTIRDLDQALTDIAVVTDMTREESWGLLETYQEMAKQVGLTTSEVAKLSIAFFRQGREARDALELTRVAAEFAKIAAINVNDAANFLTAAINGFNLAASDATMIIDKFAALGAGAAASAQEIAIALSKVAPAAASAGVEVDTLMAFVTKGIETTREAPENIGTAFKTIFARMRQLTDIGKTVEDGMDLNRVDNALKSIGVSLTDATGQFRDLDDVLIDVGKRWSSINRMQQAYVATSLAGTRQQTRLIALFEDFDRTLELVEVSQNSAGEAAIQHDEYMQGMEATVTRLKTSFQELITAFVNSDVIIGIINALNTAIELLNNRVGRLLITFGALATAFSAIKTAERGLLGGVRTFFEGAIQEDGTKAVSMFKRLTTSLVTREHFDLFKANAKKAFTSFTTFVGDALETMQNGFVSVGLNVTRSLQSLGDQAGESFAKIFKQFGSVISASLSVLVNRVSKISGLFKNALNPILKIQQEVAIKAFRRTFKTAATDIEFLGRKVQDLTMSFRQMFMALVDFGTNVTGKISSGFLKMTGVISNGFSKMSGSIKNTVKEFMTYRKALDIIKAKEFSQDAVENLRLQAAAINNLNNQARFQGNALIGLGRGFRNLGNLMMAPFKALGKFLLSPAGIVMIVLGIVVAFKKIREATDTTNPTIARMKVAFDRLARGAQEIFKQIVDFVIPAFKALFNILRLINPFAFALGLLFDAIFDLSSAEEAAAELRVLNNEYKAMQKEIRESEKQLTKLNKTLKDFTNLNRATFKSSSQIDQLEETTQQIRDILAEEGILTTGLTTAQLEDELRILIADQEAAIEENYDQMRIKIKQYFEQNPLLNFEEALLDPAFDDELKDSLSTFAQEYAKAIIKGFDAMEPEVQAALLRMVRVDPAQFLDQTKEITKAFQGKSFGIKAASAGFFDAGAAFAVREGESIEEAFERFSKTAGGRRQIERFGLTIEEFAQQTAEAFATIGQEISTLYTKKIPELSVALERIQSPELEGDFIEGMKALQEIDLSELTPDELDSLFTAFPNLSNLLDIPLATDELGNFTEEALAMLQRIEDRGGVAFLQQFDGIRQALDDLILREESATIAETREVKIDVEGQSGKIKFTTVIGQTVEQAFQDFIDENPTADISFEEFAEQIKDNLDVTMTGVFSEDTADQLNDYIMTAFSESDDMYATAERLGKEVATGTLDGVELGFEGQKEILSSILNFLNQQSLENLTQSTFALLDDINKITEISQKRGDYTAEDLALLQKYPGVMEQIAAGEFDIAAFKQEQIGNTKEQIKLERSRFLQANAATKAILEAQLASGELDERDRRRIEDQIASLNDLEAETLAYYDLLLDSVESTGTDTFLDSQKELLNIQKQSIERARELRDLQAEAAEAVSRSIQATRIGAVGSIEAQFNQAQLNEEIAAANRRLEEEIMMAQIEAQQKILEDAQQQAILEATADNTEATNTNSDRLRLLTDAVNKVLGPNGSRPSTLATNSGGSTIFNDSIALVQG